jgi:hypothetical protein
MYFAWREMNPAERNIDDVIGLTAKEEARNRFEAWVRAEPAYKEQHEYLYIEETAERFKRCQIGPLTLRQSSLDEGRKRGVSYYLAEVGGGKVRVCRAAGFIYHRPPGVAKDEEGYKNYVIFILPEWLYSAYPLLTEKSKLPIVVMPDQPESEQKWIKSDADAMDGVLERVWPVVCIRPTPICGKLRIAGSHSRSPSRQLL